MTDHGAQQVARIQQDLSCPQCEYNLRGLAGDVVNCPECGLRIDVARLVAQRWQGPWTRAPGLTTVGLPVAWASISPLLILPAHVYLQSSGRWSSPAQMYAYFTVAGVAYVAVWLALLWFPYRLFDGWRGVWLALLEHVLAAGYLLSVVSLILCIVGGVASFTSGLFADGVICALVALIAGGVLYVSRRVERYVGEQCIRRHLARQVARAPD